MQLHDAVPLRGRAFTGPAVLFLVLAALALVGAPRGLRADDMAVEIDNAAAGCMVRGTFETRVPDSVAWAVLTDYDHISRFVSSMRSSEVVQRHGDSLVVRQQAVGGLWFIHRRMNVVLEIRQVLKLAILFHDVSGQDFKSYAGAWRLVRDGDELHVQYELAAEPRLAVPKGLCRGVLRRTALELLTEVRTEMTRRAAAPGPALGIRPNGAIPAAHTAAVPL